MGKITRHNGDICVEFIARHFTHLFKANLRRIAPHDERNEKKIIETIAMSLQKTFKELDARLFQKLQDKVFACGSTAIIAIVFGTMIICANLGDSVAMVAQESGNVLLSIQMTPVY
jgi:serine/threonine protein phosphatase PrpC